jgi:outer membrane protein TolC
VQDETVNAARKSVDLTTSQYKEGTVSYLDVITVQTIAVTTRSPRSKSTAGGSNPLSNRGEGPEAD